MSYQIHGEGRPLVLLHGGVGAIEMFGEVLPLLLEGRRAVAVDLQAHGLAARIVKLAEATRVLAPDTSPVKDVAMAEGVAPRQWGWLSDGPAVVVLLAFVKLLVHV